MFRDRFSRSKPSSVRVFFRGNKSISAKFGTWWSRYSFPITLRSNASGRKEIRLSQGYVYDTNMLVKTTGPWWLFSQFTSWYLENNFPLLLLALANSIKNEIGTWDCLFTFPLRRINIQLLSTISRKKNVGEKTRIKSGKRMSHFDVSLLIGRAQPQNKYTP